MTAIEENLYSDTGAMLKAHFDTQRALYLATPNPDLSQRKQDLENLKRMINENREEIINAISRDYGNRSRHETQFAEIISVTDGINDVIKNLKKWTKVQKRHVDHSMFFGAKNRVIPQALGVVGCRGLHELGVEVGRHAAREFKDRVDPAMLKHCLLYTSPSPRD